LNLSEWSRTINGFDGWWTCWQFDSAVNWAGAHIENLLMERDPSTHKQRYSLDSILADTPSGSAIDYLKSVGIAGTRKIKVKKQ
jgi:hypothetical protein